MTRFATPDFVKLPADPCQHPGGGRTHSKRGAARPRLKRLPAILAALLLPLVPVFWVNAALAQTLAVTDGVADPAVGLKLDHALAPRERSDKAEVPVFGRADSLHGQLDTEAIFDGHAELRKSGSVIHAQVIRYRQLEDDVIATGDVRIVRDGDVYTGPQLHLRFDDYSGYFDQPKFKLLRSEGRGEAKRVDFIDRDRANLIDPIYTTCRADNTDWYLKADEMQLDQITQTGEGKNAVVYFKGVPILASPWISFPLDDGRKSGLLPPSFGFSSKGGGEVTVPYYWNIAPNRDLTVYPKYINTHGLQLGGDFRYLEPHYNGETFLELLPNDTATHRERYSMVVKHNWADYGFSGYVNFAKVSDDQYFTDFARSIAGSSQRTLARDGSISYGGSDWTLTGRVLRYQTIQDPLNPVVPPYEKLPQFIYHQQRLNAAGFDVSLDGEFTRFWHPTETRGDRLVINPAISYPVIRPGWFMTPKFSINAARYALDTDTVAPGATTQLSRSTPTFSFDSGLVYERDTSIFGTAYRQTLEPRLFYVRTPYRDQSGLPNFDSGLTDFNFSQLFSENTFSGSDRIADANQVTVAAVTRYLNPETGAELVRAAIGQRYYFSEQRVTLPGGSPIDSRKSDFLAAVSGQITPTVALDSAIDYSPAVSGIARTNLNVRWQPAPTKVLNAGYRYLRGDIEQVDLSTQWPLGGNWYGVGRLNYSIRDNKPIESLAGFEYNGCCWVVRFVSQRFVTSTNASTTSYFIQLELNGFSRIGSNPLDALKRNISGYQPINAPATPPSPFSNYE